MPYIGKNPVGGGFHKLDALTASATDTYALTLNSAAYYPESANQLLVSLNGVIQAPQDSFTVSGSNLVFDTALTTSDSIDFVVALGDVLAVQTVTDGAITTAKLGNDAVTKAKMGTTELDLSTIKDGTGTNTAMTIDSSGVASLTSGSIGKIGTPVSLNGLSETEYTSLPSDVSAIDVTFAAASFGTADGFIGVQLGTASGYETSGYYVANPYMTSGSTSSNHNTNYADFRLFNFGNVANVFYFHYRIMNHGSNNWLASGHGYTENGSYYVWLTGYKSLSDTLTKVKIKTATGNFDAGTVNVNYYR